MPTNTPLRPLSQPRQEISAADINAFLDANWNPDTDSDMENIEGLSDASDTEEQGASKGGAKIRQVD